MCKSCANICHSQFIIFIASFAFYGFNYIYEQEFSSVRMYVVPSTIFSNDGKYKMTTKKKSTPTSIIVLPNRDLFSAAIYDETTEPP